eukprot:95398_1
MSSTMLKYIAYILLTYMQRRTMSLQFSTTFHDSSLLPSEVTELPNDFNFFTTNRTPRPKPHKSNDKSPTPNDKPNDKQNDKPKTLKPTWPRPTPLPKTLKPTPFPKPKGTDNGPEPKLAHNHNADSTYWGDADITFTSIQALSIVLCIIPIIIFIYFYYKKDKRPNNKRK